MRKRDENEKIDENLYEAKKTLCSFHKLITEFPGVFI